MIENWIDAIQDVWRGISGKNVNAPYLLKQAEFPTSIDPANLAANPIALTLVAETKFLYSAGGPNLGFYTGVTEFHIAPSVEKSLLPGLMIWPGLIAEAAAANLGLGGRVKHFTLQDRDDQISGPLELQYGNESPHWGFIVYWKVKESVNSAITVAVGA